MSSRAKTRSTTVLAGLDRTSDAGTAPDLDLPAPHQLVEDTNFQHRLTSLISGFEAERARFGENGHTLPAQVASAAEWISRLTAGFRRLPPECQPKPELEAAEQFLVEAGRLATPAGGWRSLFGLRGGPAVGDDTDRLRLLCEMPQHLKSLLTALGGGFHHERFAAEWRSLVSAFLAELRAEMAWLPRAAARKCVLN